MAVRVLLSVKEAWFVAHSLQEKRDHLRRLVNDSPQSSASSYVRDDLAVIEQTLAKLLTPEAWLDPSPHGD